MFRKLFRWLYQSHVYYVSLIYIISRADLTRFNGAVVLAGVAEGIFIGSISARLALHFGLSPELSFGASFLVSLLILFAVLFFVRRESDVVKARAAIERLAGWKKNTVWATFAFYIASVILAAGWFW
jgi:hypothetical protein